LLFDEPLLTGCYTATFLIGAALPGWRSIAGAAAAGAVLLGLIWSRAGGGLGWLELALLTIALLGLASGIAARALSLAIAPYRTRPLRAFVIVAACYVVAPMLVAGPAKSWQWLSRLSLQGGRDTTFPVLASGSFTFRVPPALAVDAPRGPARHDRGEHFSLWSESSLLRFCRRALEGNGPFAAPIVGAVPDRARQHARKRPEKDACTTPSGPANHFLFQLADKDHSGTQDRASFDI
jgi:hypothetical protein